MWRQRWALSKFMYLFCRYAFTIIILITFFLNTSINPPEQLCRGWQNIWTWIFPSLSTLVADALILVRLDALYRTDRQIRFLILLAYTMHVIVALVAGILNSTMSPVVVLSQTPPNSTHRIGCEIGLEYVSEGLNIFVLAFPLITQILYFILTVIRCLESAKEVRMAPRLRFTSLITMTKTVPIMFGLLRDGALYFFLALVIYVAFIILVFTSPQSQLWIPGTFAMLAANPLIAARLYLGMKARGRANGNGTRMLAFEEGLDRVLLGLQGITIGLESSTTET